MERFANRPYNGIHLIRFAGSANIERYWLAASVRDTALTHAYPRNAAAMARM